jgi:hypothetical protein
MVPKVPSVAEVSLGLASSGAQIRTLSLETSHYAFVLALHRPPSQAKNDLAFLKDPISCRL